MSALPPKADIERRNPAGTKRVFTAFQLCALGGVFRMASTNRLLLHALLNGLGDAVHRNDEAAADRYHRRISLIAGHFETNASVSDALERLLSASGHWLATKTAERYEAGQRVLELIEPVVDLL
jgi:hypothetical protein